LIIAAICAGTALAITGASAKDKNRGVVQSPDPASER